jgi:hypothetical protein
MDLDSLIAIVGVIIVLSTAAERLVEIIKGSVQGLSQVDPDPVKEEKRKARLQLIAVAASLVTSFLAVGPIGSALGWTESESSAAIGAHWLTLVGLGLLAAGGSSLWNSILGYLLGLKDIKKSEALATRLTVQTQMAAMSEARESSARGNRSGRELVA